VRSRSTSVVSEYRTIETSDSPKQINGALGISMTPVSAMYIGNATGSPPGTGERTLTWPRAELVLFPMN
jgi:hypothetical protein